jgi:hypothetical protein
MAVSSFYLTASTAIDSQSPALTLPATFDLGTLYIGGSKSLLRRTMITFDVFGAAAEGRPLAASDTPLDAVLECEVLGLSGPAGFPCTIERNARGDWDPLTANWNRYRVGANWTAAGGDVAAPPAAIAYAAPSALGAFVISGVLPLVADAVANRNGRVEMRHRSDNESPGSNRYFALAASWNTGTPVRLRVTYQPRDPAPIDRPRAAGGAMPGARAAPPSRPATGAVPANPAHPEGGN